MKSDNEQINPPSWVIRFIEWFCPTYLLEGVLGDMYEQFDLEIAQTQNIKKAKLKFVWNVMRLFHPYIIFQNQKLRFINMSIYKNHIVVVTRSMKKYKFYATVNIIGLALALSFVFLSYLFIDQELAHDQFHINKDRTYRLYNQLVDKETETLIPDEHNGVTPVPLIPDLRANLSGLKYATRYGSNSATLFRENKPFQETVTFVDSDFLKMFSFPLIQGHKEALTAPNAIVLTPKTAKKYFGDDVAIGKELKISLNDSLITLVVKGIVDNMQHESSLSFELLVPFELMKIVSSDQVFKSYDISFSESWVMFESEFNPNASDEIRSIVDGRMDETDEVSYFGLQPLHSIHFDQSVMPLVPPADPQKLWILGGLALLVLTIALINYITLSTGHSMHRIKEIGLRKTFGAHKSKLRTQLIFEAFIVTIFSSMVAIALTYYALPFFNELVGSNIQPIGIFYNLVFLILLVTILSFISGGIQAIILVGISPMTAIHGTSKLSSKESWINQGVIIFQFSIAALLICGTLVIHQQMNFVNNKSLGFDPVNLVEINLNSSDDLEATELLVQRLKSSFQSSAMIESVGASMNSFREPWSEVTFEQEDGSKKRFFFNQIDDGYLETMKIKLNQGDGINSTNSNAGTNMVINQTLANEMGWGDFSDKRLPSKNKIKAHRVIGITQDFHFSSLHNEVKPIFMTTSLKPYENGIVGLSTYVWPPNLFYVLVRFNAEDRVDVINLIEEKWHDANPNKQFTYNFVDDQIADMYREEAKWGKVINLASIFAIIIAWIGLIGLTRLTVQKRIKEIGIRKVLGSSTLAITRTLSKQYFILVFIGVSIAMPVGWVLADNWLQEFTYRINLDSTIFLISGFAVLFITIGSVAFQAFNAATVNPVESLKME